MVIYLHERSDLTAIHVVHRITQTFPPVKGLRKESGKKSVIRQKARLRTAVRTRIKAAAVELSLENPVKLWYNSRTEIAISQVSAAAICVLRALGRAKRRVLA